MEEDWLVVEVDKVVEVDWVVVVDEVVELV